MEHPDRPIIENGTLYELPENEMRAIESLIYFCEECNAFHVKPEDLDQFNKIYNPE